MGGLTLGRTQLPPWSTNRSEAALYQFVLFAIKHNRRKWSRPPRRGRPSSSVMEGQTPHCFVANSPFVVFA